jgi:hypothetical protein
LWSGAIQTVMPYRDELDTLRAENDRLRLELSKRRSYFPRLALLLAAFDVALCLLLRPWLNGKSDARFWMSLGTLGLVAVLAIAAAIGRKSPKP